MKWKMSWKQEDWAIEAEEVEEVEVEGSQEEQSTQQSEDPIEEWIVCSLELDSQIEALIFASDRPLTAKRIHELCGKTLPLNRSKKPSRDSLARVLADLS
jgi:hypothetical protein